MISLPYIPLDEDFNLNVALLIILIHTLSKNRNDVLLLDRNKIQIFLYLIKNPSKLEAVMILAGKQNTSIDMTETYTIKSLSLNVDILFSTPNKNTFEKVSILGWLRVTKSDGASYFSLTTEGERAYSSLAANTLTQ